MLPGHLFTNKSKFNIKCINSKYWYLAYNRRLVHKYLENIFQNNPYSVIKSVDL